MSFKRFIMFPFQDKDWVKKILLGCVISIVPVLNLLTLGYFLKCIKMGMEGRANLPEWEEWAEHIREGFMAFIIAFIYLLVPILLALPLISIPVVGVLLLAILVLLVGLLIPLALAAYSERKNLMDAFRIQDIIIKLSRIINPYAAAYLFTVFILTLGLSIVILLPHLAFLGVLVMFYFGLVFFNLLGSIWN
ncbi:MAG: DUF4013 domain-containing protein [Syntrophomonadaceae bacterium]|nr:DUF4013 domain-containing protein [Syntrophomonadaceae bacterium]MDD3023731.1 DUF4013 domain-containing protein [Syntrophomonadaceae bacterium]